MCAIAKRLLALSLAGQPVRFPFCRIVIVDVLVMLSLFFLELLKRLCKLSIWASLSSLSISAATSSGVSSRSSSCCVSTSQVIVEHRGEKTAMRLTRRQRWGR